MTLGLLTPAWAQTTSLEFGPGTILVYETRSASKEAAPFVIRIARFEPDIVLEWETVSFQGTMHLFRAAVRSSRRITTGGVFDPGVDIEAKDWTVKWLSRALYEDLMSEGATKILLNNTPAHLEVTGKETFDLTLNGQEVSVQAFKVRDDRRGSWIFLDDPRNPIALGYETPYYQETLQRVATNQKGSLRWIKRLPPVK